MTLRLAFTKPRMMLLASLLMACGGKGKSVGTDAGDRRDGSVRDVVDARMGETASPDNATAAKDAGLDRLSPLSPDVRADETASPDMALAAIDAEVDRFMPATPDAAADKTGDAWVGPADAPWSVPPDATGGFDTRPGADTRQVDTAAPEIREVGAEVLLPLLDAPADSTLPIDQASRTDAPYGLDGPLGDAEEEGDADLADASPGGCTERPGVSCRVCNPVRPGAPISFDVPDGIKQLIPDRSACLVYGFDPNSPSQIVVFDAAQKTVLTRVALGGNAADISLSPSGTFLVASLNAQRAIAVVDKTTWTTSLVGTTARPMAVAVNDRGLAYYTNTNGPSLRGIDLTAGSSSDKGMSGSADSDADLALSPDGTRLYWGEYGSTGSDLYILDLTVATPTVVSRTTWDQGYGFSLEFGDLLVGSGGKYIYYADHQLDATNLGFVVGSAIDVYAEDSQARFAASATSFLDARTLTTLSTLPREIQAAAFISADSELWTYSLSERKITCTNVADLTGGKTPGLREGTASAIGTYELGKLIADPVRPRLYGLDIGKRMVVSIDRASGAALGTVVVGSTPTDLEIDTSGTFIYAGHSDTYAIAQIDAASFTFVKFIPSPQDSYDIAPLASDRIASIDEDNFNEPAVIDVSSGTVLDSITWDRPTEGALFATADGHALFIGESGSTGSIITRYDVSDGGFVSVGSSYSGIGSEFHLPFRSVVGTPDGTSIYYAGYCLDGTNLASKRYRQTDRILTVSPNGALAISETTVYRVSDGAALATLPSACPVQAVGPDSSTVYCAGSSGISSFSLAGLP